ncbi:C13 family peptidase [Piscinibacter sp. HJYY11]|uniref:C13 family peptidase n=1 Tax=Piscinibacter sp. HJYY11 TaxID=2801333 RepID=UPI001F2F7FF4|nr:C13 family peptidase [Piscinibacter sp. HJYY11]
MNTFRRWAAAAVRSVFFRKPSLEGLRIGPLGLVLLAGLLLATSVVVQRLHIPGPALFYWQSLGGGWLGTVLFILACWMAARGTLQDGASVLLALVCLVQMLISWPLWGAYFVAERWLPDGLPAGAGAMQYLLWVPMGWTTLANVVLLARHAERGTTRAGVVLVVAAAVAVSLYLPRSGFWYPDMSAAADELEDKRLQLSQEVLEAQSASVVSTLQALQPQRPGVADVYAITFAPYAGEEVFRRESRLVSQLMQERFDAQGRTLSLINHAETARELPWATGLNLRRAIQQVASLMDREEDILFIHLTSHGARDGRLAAQFDPLEVDELTPEKLRAWLDEAGVRWRVLSISACYSGSWLPALADPGTLTMTAADATHTSYGCGRGSELTYFGRAMYAEQLRKTRSFEAAHAAAREVIDQREKAARKTDGYSNPQIQMGEAIRPRLAELEKRLDAAAQ